VASVTGALRLAHVAGAIGIVGQLASAFFYLLFPFLIVPRPTSYAFYVTWTVLVGLAIVWWRRHPIRSFVVPIVSVPAVLVVLWVGTMVLGWAG